MREFTLSSGSAVDIDAVPGTTIRFFLSSTFVDFQVERDILQRRVFPELRKLCAASGYRLQPIDLRWGVSEAAGTDRQTLRICFDELDRCYRLSPDCFLLIQLGQRYGSYILPPAVSTGLAKRLLTQLSAEERARFNAAYRLDENAVPPEYALLRAEGPERAEDEALRTALVRAGQAAGGDEEERLLFEGSATHREIQLGLLGQPAERGVEAGVLCAVRTFTGKPVGPAAATYAAQDAERAARVVQLTDAVLERVPGDQVLRYAVRWDGERGPAFDEDALARAYVGLLRPKLEAVINRRRLQRPIVVDLERGDQILPFRDAAFAAERGAKLAWANARFEETHAHRLEGRDAERAAIVSYLRGERGAGFPLVITGERGSGKSTLLAAVANRAKEARSVALVTRYLGVTPEAESLTTLLKDLREEIAQAYDEPPPTALTGEDDLISAVAAEFATFGAPLLQPLLIFIDGLDRLSSSATRMDWLPPRLGDNVRVVVSIASDRPELLQLRDRLPAQQILTLEPLDVGVGRSILRNLLREASRTLTLTQETTLLDAFTRQRLPLHLHLMALEALRWRSFDPPTIGDTLPPETVPDLLQAMLARLESPRRHGRVLVARAMGNLAAATYGLAEDEMLDLLARDGEVRAGQRALSSDSPPIDPDLPLPVSLWARLYAEIGPLLAEQEMGRDRLTTFYHEELRSAAQLRYLAGPAEQERHRALADYFASQPWRLGADTWNVRKLLELVPQLERAGDRAGAEQTLEELVTDLETALRLQKHGSESTPIPIQFLVGLLEERLLLGGHWRVATRFYDLKRAALGAKDDRAAQATALLELGDLMQNTGQMQEASRYYHEALDTLRSVGDRANTGAALNGLGDVSRLQGRAAEAVDYYEQALEIERESHDRSGEAQTLNNLGILYAEDGQLAEARAFYQQALHIRRELGNRVGEGSTLHNLGGLALGEGHLSEARDYLTRALEIRREVGDRPGEGGTLTNLGILYGGMGQLNEARDYLMQALEIRREVGDRAGEGLTLVNLGNVCDALGEREVAASYFEQALAIFVAIGAVHRAVAARERLKEVSISKDDRGRRWPFGRRR
jgi:tetratricopeptide (TPR) repeat protein